MGELLKQGLVLTGWGMGMTFLAIGALVAGMVLLTLLNKEKREPAENAELDEMGQSPEIAQIPEHFTGQHFEEDNIEVEMAAAAAVAIALAQMAEKQPLAHRASGGASNAWDAYVRGRHLSQRSRYEQLKSRS